MIAIRRSQALATKTMIEEQDFVTVLIVTAFSNFLSACATYVLVNVNLVDSEKGRKNKRTISKFISLNLEFKTLLRDVRT